MHELSITLSIVEAAVATAAGRRVRRVSVEIGALSGVMADAIMFCFELAALGTTVEGAELEIRRVDGRVRCWDCETEFAVASIATPCSCGSFRLAVLAGEELNLSSIELENAI
jgi:hydrogenase nickel incorporation protein HypA/HybF